MAFIKIKNNDYSALCSGLKVKEKYNYNAQTNAAGNTVVDIINKKRVLEVSIIPLADADIKQLANDVNGLSVWVNYRNPRTGVLEGFNALIDEFDLDYYTIQTNRVLSKEINLTFTEL